jgi:hypothetical protein
MKKTGKQLIYGILLLIVSGAVVVLNIRAIDVGFKQLWPFLVLIAGLVLALTALAGRRGNPLLVAAGAFLCFAAVFLFVLATTSWRNIFFLWPGFVLAVGLALAASSAFGGAGRVWRIPAAVLVVIALLSWVLYTVKSRYGTAVGAAVFLAAGYFLARGAGLEVGTRPQAGGAPLPAEEAPAEEPAAAAEQAAPAGGEAAAQKAAPTGKAGKKPAGGKKKAEG